LSGEVASRKYLVIVDNPDADEMEVERLSGTGTGPHTRTGNVSLPAFAEAHNVNSSLVVISKTAKRAPAQGGNVPSRKAWHVTISYGTITPAGPGGSTGSSDNIRVRITDLEQTVYTQLAFDTVDGAANTPVQILNSVGDLYPDPIEVPVADTQIEVEYESSTIDNEAWDNAKGKINDSVVTLSLPQGTLTYSRTFPTHTLWLKAANREVIFSKSNPAVAKWRNQVVLVYREDSWDIELPDKGYRWYVGSAEDAPLTGWKDHAAYLNGNGERLLQDAELVRLPALQRYKEHDLASILGTI
jgi:hypothetical protein